MYSSIGPLDTHREWQGFPPPPSNIHRRLLSSKTKLVCHTKPDSSGCGRRGHGPGGFIPVTGVHDDNSRQGDGKQGTIGSKYRNSTGNKHS